MSLEQRFGSRWGTLVTMVGVAVGLGNVWRFPYMMGRFGGSAFLIVYLVFVVLLAAPALLAEWGLGRATRHGPVGAFAAAFGRGGEVVGLLLVASVLVATSYYTVVVANVVYTTGFSLALGFDGGGSLAAYARGLETGWLQAGIGLLLIASVLLVLHRGLRRGIEQLSKLFVPLAGVTMLYLIVATVRLPGALPALLEFLRPDFAALDATSLFAAMGQAFFSLSLGGTFYVIYGSYLRDDERLPRAALLTAAGDVLAALLATMFIVPATLSFGLDLETGPRLIFETLPELFARVPAGRLLGTLFLLALAAMAYLSVLAAFQVLVGTLEDRFAFAPQRALAAVGVAEAALLVPVALRPQVISTLDLVFGSGMQCLGSGLAVVALTWGLGAATTRRQLFPGREDGVPVLYLLWARFVVPSALATVLGLFVLDALG